MTQQNRLGKHRGRARDFHLSLVLLLVSLTLTLFSCTSSPQATPSTTFLPTQSLTPDPSPTMTPTASLVLETINGTFRNQISILERNMPHAGSEKYVIPDQKEQGDFAKVVSLIYSEELEQSAALASEHHYTLSYYVDRGEDYATSYLLRETRPIEKGWGLFALRLESRSNIIVEAPHPLFDKRTPSVALDIYRALDARALLIAGAHRNANRDGSADVAHAPESIFQSVHQALSQEIQAESGEVIILQIHGFHTSKHEGYPQVVFGLGENAQTDEVALAQRIKDALSGRGISAGICAGTESELQDLCARTNIQGSTSIGAAFLHIELDETVRNHDDALVAALVQVLGQ